MFDYRPVGYVIGLLVAALGAVMLLPMLADLISGNEHWFVFLVSSLVTMLVGGLIALACQNGIEAGLTIRQTFVLTTGVWVMLPVFGAIPFVLGETQASYTDAFFEAMSGLTTTGSTVFTGLDHLPEGLLLWRGLMQWLGGIGIIVVAMVFLPELRVGGMQIFRSEAFDTFGKILPRAGQIASQISVIYFLLTAVCALVYGSLGMEPLDAVTHAMTTIATGGFANYDASFGAFGAGAEYAATTFMILAGLPFVRYVQMVAGSWQAPLRDPQVRAFVGILGTAALLMVLWQVSQSGRDWEPAIRKSLFNVASIITGTGYASEDYMLWGAFPVTLFFFVGLVGGCAGSTACSVKVFRYQLLFGAIMTQVKALHSPRGMFPLRYDGRVVSEDVLNSVMSFFVMFTVTLGALSAALALTGLDFITSVSGAGAALGNIGPGLGPIIGPAGNFADLNTSAKWLLSAGMLIGRLELLVVFALFTVNFWRR
ncbi:TrkH family potassium uptake protein [Aliiruegeria sabulilitoris]|uniref:TrkH family potassium uptake protein n=1 Tax=Aliiruegeria sabulilitoris TaxID=1510458 RepID=UPI0008330BB3|nr:TrkH family potassium uptake protein [Aliiruegeria sabulilitoris]NDR56887.1 TrkH family potassium uptake protein [Pseudoruegeria sp. M32A2M]